MKTERAGKRYHFQALGRREIVADHTGGTITSDGGGLLLREVEKRTGILNRFAECFTNHRSWLDFQVVVEQDDLRDLTDDEAFSSMMPAL